MSDKPPYRNGIVLSDRSGTRLHPAAGAISKLLLGDGSSWGLNIPYSLHPPPKNGNEQYLLDIFRGQGREQVYP